jgi:hypothetical protein
MVFQFAQRYLLTVILCAAVLPAFAQTADLRAVPYRLTTESKEEIEIRIVFKNNYKEVDRVEYDITVPKSNGDHAYKLKANEGGMVLLTFNVRSNRVESARINTDVSPVPQQLSVSSKSGERIIFLFAGNTNNVKVSSDRIK